MEKLRQLCCVILNYNSAVLTEKLAKQISGFALGIKICIVDNRSTDNSFESLATAGFESDILLVESEKNGGYSYGNNYGYRRALEKWTDIKYLAILNPDIWIETSECFISLLTDLECDEKLVAVKPLMLLNGERIALKYSGWRLADKKERILSHTLFDYYKKSDEYHGKMCGNLFVTDVLSGSFFVIRADIFSKIGGFDENIFLYCEESILSAKIKRLGNNYYCAVDLNCEYDHRHKELSSTDYTKKINVIENTYKSLLYMFSNYYSPNRLELLLFKTIQTFWLKKAKVRIIIRSFIKKKMVIFK